MTSRTRRILSWSLLLILTLAGIASCRKGFSAQDYQLTVLSVKPGVWDNGKITRYPSVDVRVDGPDTQDWEIVVSPDNGATPYEESAVTGRICTVVLEGIDLSKDRREVGLTIQAIHVNTGEPLPSDRQHKATLEGNFEPVITETISVTGLSAVIGEETSSITVTDGHRASFDVLENYTGSLFVTFRKDQTETGTVSCTLSQTEGDTHMVLSPEGITPKDDGFVIPFATGEPGTGTFSIVLKGQGPETVLTVSYIVKSRPYEATLTPSLFNFTHTYDAVATVNAFGFREGEKCDVVLYWKESVSGREGSTLYPGADAKAPVEVILWKAGEAAAGEEYVFWAQVFAEGEIRPAAATQEYTVKPLSVDFRWRDARGDTSQPGEKVRSWASSSICTLDVQTASWATEHIKNVSVKDITAGRAYASEAPLSQPEGLYAFEMKHPKRGVHSFTVTLETSEGDYSFETQATFIDVWTMSPYPKGSSLHANFRGPASSIKTDCNISFTLRGYAIWDYTVAETDASGQHVNTPKQTKKYIGSRTEPFTIESGTANGSSVKLVSGLFKIAMNMLKDKCSGKPFSMSGQTATRWSSDKAVTYTPAASKTFIIFETKADAAFYNDFNDIETDISQMKSTFNQNGILY